MLFNTVLNSGAIEKPGSINTIGRRGSRYPAILDDGNTVAWYDYKENITEVVGVSVWGDKSGNGNDLKQADTAKQPTLDINGILFQDDFMQTLGFTLNQPVMIYIVLKQVSWVSGDRFFDGVSGLDSGMIYQTGSSPDIKASSGTLSGADSNLTVNTFDVVRCLFNGTSSKLQVNSNNAITGDFGASNMGGFTLGARQSAAKQSHIQVKEVIIREVVDNATDEQDIYDYLTNEHSIPSRSLDAYFSAEKTIVAAEVDKHYACSSMVYVNDRLYCTYRNGRSHQSFDGLLETIYSDDDGATWSSPVTLYDGAEIITDNPDILIDDSRCVPDVRFTNSIITEDGYLLVLCFVAIGYNLLPEDSEPEDPDNIDLRFFSDILPFQTVALKIPIDGDDIEIENKTISYFTGTAPYSGALCYHNGILYASTYNVTGNTNVYLHTSSDDGETWVEKSLVFSAASGSLEANETFIYYIGEVMYIIGRGTADENAYGVLARSYDYGVTWEDYTTLPTRVDSPYVVVQPNGKALVYGRNAGNQIVLLYKLAGLTVVNDNITVKTSDNNDCGYGTVIKRDGIYYLSYHFGATRAEPNPYDHAYAGIYFKTIEAKYIEY